MPAVSLVIADDHPVVLQGLIALLREHSNFKLVGSCSNGLDCINTIRNLLPDVALLDINMPNANGLDVLKMVTAEGLPTRIIFLAASPSDREIMAAVEGGAFGIMLKESAPDMLVNCAQFERVDNALTEREREVMLLVVDGLSNKEVARRLNISEGTVKVFLHSIYQKVSVNNRTALAKFASLYRDRMR